MLAVARRIAAPAQQQAISEYTGGASLL
jgi:hypothetical protein